MNNRGKLWVIPNEEEIIQEVFEKNVKLGESHTFYLQEFSDSYMLGFKFQEDDYQTAPCEIAEAGHMVVKSEDSVSLVICYLPEKITDRQYNWLHNNQRLLSSHIQVNGYNLNSENEIKWGEVHGLNEIMMIAGKKNLLSEKGKGK